MTPWTVLCFLVIDSLTPESIALAAIFDSLFLFFLPEFPLLVYCFECTIISNLGEGLERLFSFISRLRFNPQIPNRLSTA